MKQNKSSRSTVLLFFLGAAMIVAALIMLVPDLWDYKQSNDTYEALKENYISEKAENTEVAEDTEGDDSWWYTDVDVKLEELQQVNADIIGWIRFDNLEQLSYPVLYSGDDEKYLHGYLRKSDDCRMYFYGGDEHTGFSGLPYDFIWT